MSPAPMDIANASSTSQSASPSTGRTEAQKEECMRTMVLLLAGLSLVPAIVQAQDDDRPRDRRHRCGDCGLREVSDRRDDHRRDGFFAAIGLGGGSESFDANDGLGWSDDKGGATGY